MIFVFCGALKPRHVAIQDSEGLVEMFAAGVIEIVLDEGIIVAGDQLIENFVERTPCLGTEPAVVQKMKSPMAFCDVVGNGTRSSFDLITHVEFF